MSWTDEANPEETMIEIWDSEVPYGTKMRLSMEADVKSDLRRAGIACHRDDRVKRYTAQATVVKVYCWAASMREAAILLGVRQNQLVLAGRGEYAGEDGKMTRREVSAWEDGLDHDAEGGSIPSIYAVSTRRKGYGGYLIFGGYHQT